MAEKYTLHNRRSPALRAQDAGKQELRSRFAIDSIEPAPAVPSAPPRPFGDLTRAQIEGLVKLAGDKVGSQLDSPRAKRRSGTRHLLEHLEKFDGRTWQERWLVSELDPDKYRGYNLTHGLKALLCLRVITRRCTLFRSNKFNQYPTHSRRRRPTRCWTSSWRRRPARARRSGTCTARWPTCAAR